jgi:clusterin-associated protein 1
MSFRELRNFCEIMRSLGYHRLVSMENFRTPNFELVADVLDWLVHRLEPGCHIPDDISTENHRTQFIKAVVEKVMARTGTKLNARKLYSADGYAVKELLRLAQVLYDAQKSVGHGDLPNPSDDGESFTLNSRLADLKSTRSLCSQIVEAGATLFELLQKESDISQDREKALRFLDGMSRNLGSNSESEVVERAVAQLLGSHGQNLEQLKQMSEELQRDEKTLEGKIRKKRQELERCKKRLGSLASVRPAFMDEYEQLEQELERYYEQYVGRFRNLDFLEHEIDELNRQEEERMEENEKALKRMQKRLRDEEWALLRGENDDKGSKGKAKKVRGGKRWMPPSVVEIEGNMDGGEDDESDGDGGEEEESDGDSDPPISVADSDSSGGQGLGGQGAGHFPPGGGHGMGRGPDAPVSIDNSVSDDDDIINETEDEDDISYGDGESPSRLPRKGGGSDMDF